MAGISRSALTRSPAYVTINGTLFYTRADILAAHKAIWQPVNTTLHGQIDKFKKDFVIKIPLTLYGEWTKLSTLFPSLLTNPTVGTQIFGTSDQALVINAKNNDRITYPNARITKLPDLFLGVDEELFAAQVEVTCLLKNSADPTDAGAYFVRDTNSYAETAFSTGAFLKTRWTAAWGSLTGMSSIVAQKGFRVAWNVDAQPDMVDGLGTIGMYIGPGAVTGACRFIPMGPTAANFDSANQAVGANMGVLLSAVGGDFTITGGAGGSVVLKNAALTEDSTAFGIEALRINEKMVETTRLFSSGVPSATATLST